MTDHSEAQACWDFQDYLGVGNYLFSRFSDRIRQWRRDVADGSIEFGERENNAFKGYLTAWLKTAVNATQRLAQLEEVYGQIEGGEELRGNIKVGNDLIADWIPPVLSKARGLHAQDLTEQEAQTVDSILKSGSAKLKGRPRTIL